VIPPQCCHPTRSESEVVIRAIERPQQLRAEKVRDACRRIENGFYYRWEYKIVRQIVKKNSKRNRKN